MEENRGSNSKLFLTLLLEDAGGGNGWRCRIEDGETATEVGDFRHLTPATATVMAQPSVMALE